MASGDDERTSLGLDLDNAEFLAKALEAKSAIAELGDSKNLEGLVSALTETAAVVGVMGAALFAVHGTMELVFDAENITALNVQFEKLSENAGIYGDKLRHDLVESSAGLISQQDLLKAANKGLVELGDNAGRMGETMELARKVSAVFGGDLVSNFENINRAVATGNERMLKRVGLHIDSKKVLDDYAKSVGTEAEFLSDAEKAQARMNAVLAKGETAFDGINPNLKENQNLWQQFKTTLADIGEVATIAFAKIAGPLVKRDLTAISEMAIDAKRYLTATLGSGTEQAEAQVERLEAKVMQTKAALIELDFKGASGMGMAAKHWALEVERIKANLVEYEAQLAKLKPIQEEANRAMAAGSLGAGAGKRTHEETDAERKKRLEAEREFEEEILKIRHKAVEAEEHNAKSIEDVLQAHMEKRELIEDEAANKETKIRQKHELTTKQTETLVTALHAETNAKILKLDNDLEADRERALKRYVKDSQSAAQGLTRAFEVAAIHNKKALTDWGHTGEETFDSFKKNFSDAFKKFGEGGISAADIVKNAMLNTIADIAEAKGSEFLAEGIATLNPLDFAAGGALLALSGFLRSQAGGGGGGGAAAAAGGGGSAAPTSAPAPSGIQGGWDYGTRTDTAPTLDQKVQSKQVTVVVQGHYFDTDQTKMALVDLIRQNQDATDYQVQQIGV